MLTFATFALLAVGALPADTSRSPSPVPTVPAQDSTTLPDSTDTATVTALASLGRRLGPESLGVLALRLPRGGPFEPGADTVRRRPRAVEYSEGYGRRLAVHRYASYTMVPLFAAQYVLGSRLLDQKNDLFAGRRNEPIDGGLRTAHNVTAAGVGVLFAVNTVTGVWNFREARRDPNGRGRRTAHALLMLAADGGFATTGLLGSRASDNTPRQARQHRNVALGSMAVAAAGASIMWFLDED